MKKLSLNDLQVKSFVTSLKRESKNTVKGGGTTGLPDCENVGAPTCNTCNPCGGGGATGAPCNNTQVPICPVSYPQIYCEEPGSDLALCTR